MLQIDVLLSCSDILSIPIESVLKIPKPGSNVVCRLCRKEVTIKRVGQPYIVEHYPTPIENNQKNILGE